MFTVTFYQKYVALCAANKTKPSPAAQKMGISKTTVNRWKNGGGVTDANLQTIANYFGVSVDELRGDDPEKPSKKEKPTAQGGELISDLPENIQKLISICLQNPDFTVLLLNLAQRMQNQPADPA